MRGKGTPDTFISVRVGEKLQERGDLSFWIQRGAVFLHIRTENIEREREIIHGGTTAVQRWENWICARGGAHEWMRDHGWTRVPVVGKTWRSGNQAHTYVREKL